MSDPASVVGASGLFSAAWYCREYPDVPASGIEPARHYASVGWKLMRDPGPFFSTSDYLGLHPDVAASDMNPLAHFELFGRQERRQTRKSRASSDILPSSRRMDGKRRVAVFACYSASGLVTDNIILYLSRLLEVADDIVFVADNDFTEHAVFPLRALTPHVLCRRHGEYDFGSYKIGIEYAREAGMLRDADELILCNDSCYGPIGGFGPLFDAMAARECDFWGLTNNVQFEKHIQSYFIVFEKQVFLNEIFAKFFSAVEAKSDVSQVVLSYEVPFSEYLRREGFKWDTLINDLTPGYRDVQRYNSNLTIRPSYLIDQGSPLVKVKAFRKTACNFDGILALSQKMKDLDEAVHQSIRDHQGTDLFTAATAVKFSLIVPFFNRAKSISRSVESILRQEHRSFEILLVDDGSDDGGADRVRAQFAEEIASGLVTLLRHPRRLGVSAARNTGLAHARHEWIAYVDSDNELKSNFLSTFASSIVEHRGHRAFYSAFERMPSESIVGRHFDRKSLLEANFIDLGTFVHARSLFIENGGFDEALRRLVDWDLLIRYTAKNTPVYIPHVLLSYHDDSSDTSRISVTESLDDARISVRLKHGLPIRVTTIIPTYNHRDFIRAAAQSALDQTGDFDHQILICDDGSDDGTAEIVAELAKANRGRIVDISNVANQGISDTFRKCIAKAQGDLIAILEGDDIWTDDGSIRKKMQFLLENRDCSMAFSKICVRSLPGGEERFLERQNSLKASKLDGADFLAHPSMNLIANFSSCLLKAGLLKNAPARLFEGRFNEIALAFYFERHGKIGFLDEPMSVYHQHTGGVWTGSSTQDQLHSGLATRRMVLDVAAPRYHEAIRRIIDERYLEPIGQLEQVGQTG